MRTPNPVVLRHRVHINIAALCLGALSLMMLIDPRYRLAGAVTLLITFLVWAYLHNKLCPDVADYLVYLKQAAEEDGHGEWLDQVDADFMQIWGIESLEALNRD